MRSDQVIDAGSIELTDELDARETVLVGASLATILLGIAYWVSRIGFDNPARPVVTAVGVSLFICSVPLWLIRLGRWAGIGSGSSGRNCRTELLQTSEVE